MKGLFPIFKRELLAYFRSPVAYVFIIIFLAANAGCTFLLGNFYNSNQASLENSFLFHPWLYLFLILQWECGFGQKNDVQEPVNCC